MEYKLSDIAKFKYGKMPKKDLITDSGYPIYTGYKVSGYYPEYMYDNEQIIIVARGVGGTGDVKLSPRKSYITNISIIVELDELKCNKYFFVYYLNTRNLRSLDSGSAQSQITIKDLENFVVEVPDIFTQEIIAGFLSNIDQKIEVNNKIISNLESQAQAIFKSWFVDFEPFQDGEFVESELGMIPKGWEVVSLSKISEIQNGFAFKSRDYKSEGIPVIRTLNIVDGTIEMNNIVSLPNEFYTDAKYKKFILKRFDTLLVMVGSTIGKIGMVHEQNIPSLQNQNMWRFRNKDIFKSQFFIYFLVKAITDEVIGWSSGSARSFFRKDIYLNRKVLIPEETILIGFERICLPIFEQISTLNLQNQKLAQTRDTLLPKLMSGEIDVSNIKIDIEEDNND